MIEHNGVRPKATSLSKIPPRSGSDVPRTVVVDDNYRQQVHAAGVAVEKAALAMIKDLEAKGYKVTRIHDEIVVEKK